MKHFPTRTLQVFATAIGLTIAAPAVAQDPVTVKVGISPYFDYQPWGIAKKLGLDKDIGIDLQFTSIASVGTGVAALHQGSIDITSSCHACDFPLLKNAKNLRSFLITDQFKGFIVVGRKGAETYSDAANGLSPEEAKKKVLDSFKGKTFAVVLAMRETLLKSALAQAGLTLKDVKFADFADDNQAALAFAGGVGDYYMGGLPQEVKLLSEANKYANVGGQEILGPAGLWFSTMDALEPWLKENHTTALKLTAIWYRMARYIKEKGDFVFPEWRAAINSAAAASFSLDEVTNTVKLMGFPTLEEAKATFFNPKSDLYWRNSVDFYKEQSADQLPANYSPAAYSVEEALFNDLIADKELVGWINSPLK